MHFTARWTPGAQKLPYSHRKSCIQSQLKESQLKEEGGWELTLQPVEELLIGLLKGICQHRSKVWRASQHPVPLCTAPASLTLACVVSELNESRDWQWRNHEFECWDASEVHNVSPSRLRSTLLPQILGDSHCSLKLRQVHVVPSSRTRSKHPDWILI